MENNYYDKSYIDNAQRSLEKMKKQEERLLKLGHRWIKISQNHSVLIPCDKNGVPTEQGERMIKMYKDSLNI